MALTRYDPWRNLSDLQREMNRLFTNRLREPEESSGTLGGEWSPPVDVWEDSNRYLLEVDVPGVDPQNIEVSLETNILTVRGERSEEKEIGGPNGELKHRERLYGPFIRSFHLPESADADQVKARYDNGVLRITIPKSEQAKAKKIKVQQ